MPRWITRVRTPVRRLGADSYLMLTLLSFAASVTLTRMFLELTGYPQLGNQEIHIAHVLWGGLLLFAAVLLPLILANRWVYPATAITGGIGIGLFIDEVGKFITQTNDYFYPPAAPIIYAFFLLTVVLYLRVRRAPARDPRARLYHALEMLEEVLDRDLEPEEREDLAQHLQSVSLQTRERQLAGLAEALLGFVTAHSLRTAPETPDLWERITESIQRWEERSLTRDRHRMILIASLGILGVLATWNLGRLLAAVTSPARLEQMVADLIRVGQVASTRGLNWFAARAALEGAVGILLLAGAALLALGRERRGVGLGYLALLLSLTTVNLLAFYFDQFSTIALAVAQFAALLTLTEYRRRFRPGRGPVAQAPPPPAVR